MGEMSMPGGWNMSMTWMRMPGQTWLEAAGSFLGMWIVMMFAMMLPSLLPRLWLYFRVSGARGGLTALVGAGYFLVWTAFGVAAFVLGVVLTSIEMQHDALARAVPLAVGVVVLIAGVLQFTTWKAHHLACCREAPACCPTHVDADSALRYGLRLGIHCAYCCASLTAVLLVIGVMDLRAMAVITIAITLERLASNAQRVARVIGVVVVAAGLFFIVRAVGLT
jgi:predicted metal-binding membrane protein